MQRRATGRPKDEATAVAELEASNFDRALRINYLEEQLLAYRRGMDPGELELMDALQQAREEAQASARQAERAEQRCLEMETAAQERSQRLEATQQRLTKAQQQLRDARLLSEERGGEIDRLTESLRELETTCAELEESEAHARQQRLKLEDGARRQHEVVQNLEDELNAACDVHADLCHKLRALRSAISDCERQLQSKDEQIAQYKFALDKARGSQRCGARDKDASRILLGQLQESQLLIEQTKARVCKLEPNSQPSLANLSILQQELHEIERNVRVRVPRRRQ